MYTTRNKYSHTHKLQASIRALTKTIEWLPKTVIQSKCLWKKSFRSHPVLSVSSKLRLFLSCQIDHIKQWGTTFLVKLLWWSPNFPCQQANSSTTVFGIIEWTPNKVNTKVHNSTAIRQWSRRWSTDSPLLLHRTNPISKLFFLQVINRQNISQSYNPNKKNHFAGDLWLPNAPPRKGKITNTSQNPLIATNFKTPSS